jgi:hypothetical protein
LLGIYILSESVLYPQFQDNKVYRWKKEIKDKIQEYWEKQWIEEAKKRISLKFLAIPKMGKTHYVWKTVPNDCIEVKKAEVKARLAVLSGNPCICLHI